MFLIQDNVTVGPSFYSSFRKIDNDRKEKVMNYGGVKCGYIDLLYEHTTNPVSFVCY